MRALVAMTLASLLIAACATDSTELPPPPPGTPMAVRKNLNTAPKCEDFQKNADGSWTAARDTVIYSTHGAEAVKQGQTFKPGEFLDTVEVARGLTRFCEADGIP